MTDKGRSPSLTQLAALILHSRSAQPNAPSPLRPSLFNAPKPFQALPIRPVDSGDKDRSGLQYRPRGGYPASKTLLYPLVPLMCHYCPQLSADTYSRGNISPLRFRCPRVVVIPADGSTDKFTLLYITISAGTLAITTKVHYC